VIESPNVGGDDRSVMLLVALFASPFKSKCRLEAENAALRHQLIVLRRTVRGRLGIFQFPFRQLADRSIAGRDWFAASNNAYGRVGDPPLIGDEVACAHPQQAGNLDPPAGSQRTPTRRHRQLTFYRVAVHNPRSL
jgi:hypothetical protein